MKQILIGKQLAYAAKVGGGTISGINEIDLLDTGAIAVFSSDNVLITSAGVATELIDKKAIIIAVGNQVDTSSKTYISTPIPRVGTDYAKKAYVAPVKQKKFVGYDGTTAGTQLNYPSTLVVGDEAQIKITDTSSGLRNTSEDVKRYSTSVRSADTAATITARLVTIMNADVDAIIVAAGVSSNTGISLEAKVASTTFDVALSGIIQDATMVEKGGAVEGVSVAPVFGEGTFDLVKALEDLYSVERGNTNQFQQPALWYSNTSLAVSGLTYNVYTFYFNGRRTTALGAQDTYTHEIKVAIPSSGTAPTTAWETIMAEAFGNPKTSESGA